MAKTARARDDLLEQLYAADLEDFTAERNALARTLRDAGRDEDAREIAERRKPPLPAFLANRLARERSREMRALIDAAATLSKAHRSGGVEKLREAQAALSDALRTLTAAAPEVTGKSVSSSVEQRLVSTLRAAAADPEAAELLRRGVLPDEVDPSGFDALAGIRVAPRPKRAEPKAKRRSAREERADAARRDRAERLERELSEANDELRAAERELAAAERTVERARRRAADLQKRLDGMR